MSPNAPAAQRPHRFVWLDARLFTALQHVAPLLLFGLRLWISASLALYIAFWLQLDNAYWAGTSAAVVCQPSLGASLRKGWYRMVGTLVGALTIVLLTACFPQDRALFLVALALWGAGCAFASTLLRGFAAYSAALAGYTVAIVASDQLGATGGLNGAAFTLAVTRASEICIGVACAGFVLAATDFGDAQQRLAAAFANLTAGITSRFAGTLTHVGEKFADTQTTRRELLRRVIALDPVVDEALGESSQLRYHSPVLQTAVDGLFAALASWRIVALRLKQSSKDEARQAAKIVLSCLPQALRSVEQDESNWSAAPTQMRRACAAAVRNLISSAGHTPSLRLLAVPTAEVLVGIARTLDGLALLTDDAGRSVNRRRRIDLRIPDWLPPLVNGGRALVVIGAAEIFWIVTGWSNGAGAITWASIVVILFAPRAEQAYASALSYAIGTCVAALFAAVVAFAVLQRLETFAALSLAIGLFLVPAGALTAQTRHKLMFTGMTASFIPLLAPANQASYDLSQFCNAALALIVGSGAAALSFRLLPPLSPAFRTRRLLALTLCDLRGIARGTVSRTLADWQGRIFGRLSAMPEEAAPLQRAELLAALSIGTAIIRLRRIGGRLHLDEPVDSALEAIAEGLGSRAIARLSQLDQTLAARSDAKPAVQRLRGLIQVISETLSQHAAYFDERVAA
jgi:uncharacterized membrane protein YccC